MRPVRTLRHPRHTLTLTGTAGPLAFSPDGRWLAVADASDEVSVVDMAEGARRHLLPHPLVGAVAFTADGRLCTAGRDRTVQVWDVAGGHRLRTLAHDDVVHAVTVEPDDAYLLTAARDGTVTRWSLDTGDAVLTVHHDAEAYGATPRPGRLVTFGADRTLRSWDVATGAPLARHDAPEAVYLARYTPDGRHLVVAVRDDTARLCDAVTLRPVRRLGPDAGFSDHVWQVEVSGDGRLVALGDDNNSQLRLVGDAGELPVVPLPTTAARVVPGPDDTCCLLHGCHDGAGDLLWDRSGGVAARLPQPYGGAWHVPRAVARFDGAVWAASLASSRLVLWATDRPGPGAPSHSDAAP